MLKVRGVISTIAIVVMGTACHAESKRVEGEPTFESIRANLDGVLASYPKAKTGEASSCAEMKVVSYTKLREKGYEIVDLASTDAKIGAKDWVYFDGVAKDFHDRSELFDVSNAKGTIYVGGSTFEAVMLIVPDTEIFFRIGKGQLLLDDSPNSFASKEGVEACGYGMIVEREGKSYVAIADVISSSNSDRKLSELGSEPSSNQNESQNRADEMDVEVVEVVEEEEFFPVVDSSGDASLQDAEEVSPSFTCKESALPSEAAICNNRSLAVLDRELEAVYRDALKQADSSQSDVKRSYLVSMQRQWLAERNKQCEADAICLEQYMRSRIAELKTN